MISVDIDSHSGFCGGVIRAIGRAEEYLSAHSRLYSLGAIVHNEEELSRLESKGLVTIGKEDLEGMEAAPGDTLLIRAHGEPPEIYGKAGGKGFEIIDCTCPVVLRLQQSIREAYARLQALPTPGQLVIFGKTGHPEVLGLVGQVGGDAVVVPDAASLQERLDDGTLDPGKDTEIFSQTTMSPEAYDGACKLLRERLAAGAHLEVHGTICSKVASRHRELGEFASSHDVIVFVAGKESSNGQVLCRLCRSVNPRTYHVGSPEGIDPSWFRPSDRVGVCGATSTPKWLLEKVAGAIENICNSGPDSLNSQQK